MVTVGLVEEETWDTVLSKDVNGLRETCSNLGVMTPDKLKALDIEIVDKNEERQLARLRRSEANVKSLESELAALREFRHIDRGRWEKHTFRWQMACLVFSFFIGVSCGYIY